MTRPTEVNKETGKEEELRLKLKIDLNELTVDEMEFLLEADKFRPSVFKEFMGRFSNWTPAQVGKLNANEMKDTVGSISKALREASVPKDPTPTSAAGVG